MTAVVVALGVAVALLAALVVGLLRSHADVLRALHDLGVDPGAGGTGPRHFASTAGAAASTQPAPGTPGRPAVPTPAGGDLAAPDAARLPDAVDVDGSGWDGTAIHLAVAGVGHRTLLAFLTTGCETCIDIWHALADPAERARVGHGTRIVVVTQGEASEMPSAVARLAPEGITTVMSASAWDAYDVPVAPFFALVDGPTGRVVGEGAAPSWDQLVDLLGRAIGDQPPATGVAPDAPRRGWAGREADTDEALLAAGIVPGDPRLHHAPATDADGVNRPDDASDAPSPS